MVHGEQEVQVEKLWDQRLRMGQSQSMEASYITPVPSGDEKGMFLSTDRI